MKEYYENMEQRFHEHLTRNFSFLKNKKLLLAISGGLDSTVLAYLCQREDLHFGLAHCNFQLRGRESDADEGFVKKLAKGLGVSLAIKKFETRSLAGAKDKSIQLIARELRYDWFAELATKKDYDYILTAHHRNDDAETFFINLLRGTGLAGLTGIPPVNQKIVRPLLPFSRAEILAFAETNSIKWREDSSNASDDYLRNRIRHHFLPLLTEESPDFLSRFGQTQRHLQEAQNLLADYAQLLKEKLLRPSGDKIYLEIKKLEENPHPREVLYLLLKEYGFTAWEDIYRLLTAQPGKEVHADHYRLLKDREFLILKPREKHNRSVILIETPESVTISPKGRIICEKVTKVTGYEKQKAYLATEKLVFPLTLRDWTAGDVFQPLGMKGRKKVSDFLKDEKLSLFEKETTQVLCSAGKIVWVVGHRIDEAFKIKENTSEILKIEVRK